MTKINCTVRVAAAHVVCRPALDGSAAPVISAAITLSEAQATYLLGDLWAAFGSAWLMRSINTEGADLRCEKDRTP